MISLEGGPARTDRTTRRRRKPGRPPGRIRDGDEDAQRGPAAIEPREREEVHRAEDRRGQGAIPPQRRQARAERRGGRARRGGREGAARTPRQVEDGTLARRPGRGGPRRLR